MFNAQGKHSASQPLRQSAAALVSVLLLVSTPVFAQSSAGLSAAGLSAADRDPANWKNLFQPLPKVAASTENQVTPEKVALGKKLYSDTILSVNGKLSCNSCHKLAEYGVDHEATSPGHEGKRGDRNSPTVYNAALHMAQFWDGRAATVEEQALGPVLNPVEMGMPNDGEVLKRLKASTEYPKLFAKAFPGESEAVTFKNMGRAIGAFERTLITSSRFDKFLEGEATALSDEELVGLKTFRDVGCIACHNGATLGGQMYQKIGLLKPYPTKDEGRFKVTKNEADKFFFKVPSLRNIEKTGPYFHDGQVKTLPEAIKLMGEHQLGRELSAAQISNITSFLHSLTGEVAS